MMVYLNVQPYRHSLSPLQTALRACLPTRDLSRGFWRTCHNNHSHTIVMQPITSPHTHKLQHGFHITTIVIFHIHHIQNLPQTPHNAIAKTLHTMGRGRIGSASRPNPFCPVRDGAPYRCTAATCNPSTNAQYLSRKFIWNSADGPIRIPLRLSR